MRTLTLDEYRSLLRRMPEPTHEQIEGFAGFVATAHSWYKHLPTWPPGVPMTFFLDPCAGMQRVVDRRGRVWYEYRHRHGFHYSSLKTAEYRDRFGTAAFARGAGTGTLVSLVRANRSRIAPNDDEPLVFDRDRKELVALPEDVVEAGTALVSGAMHPRADLIILVHVHAAGHHGVDWRSRWPTEWPEESGGAATLTKLFDRVEALLADPDLQDDGGVGSTCGADRVVYELLTTERARQQRGIVRALERVVAILGA
jgi:hypothetical protein